MEVAGWCDGKVLYEKCIDGGSKVYAVAVVVVVVVVVVVISVSDVGRSVAFIHLIWLIIHVGWAAIIVSSCSKEGSFVAVRNLIFVNWILVWSRLTVDTVFVGNALVAQVLCSGIAFAGNVVFIDIGFLGDWIEVVIGDGVSSVKDDFITQGAFILGAYIGDVVVIAKEWVDERT